MILIADSGSTKTNWVLLTNDTKTIEANTQGFNPYFQTSRIIEDAVRNELSKKFYPTQKKKSLLFFIMAQDVLQKIKLNP